MVPVAAVLLPRRARQVAPDDALDRQHLGPVHEHDPSLELRAGGPSAGTSARSVEIRWLPADSAKLVEPERGHGREHPALLGNRFGHHHVEGRDPVGGDHEQPAVAGVVDVADLARVDERQVDVGNLMQGGGVKPPNASDAESGRRIHSAMPGKVNRSSPRPAGRTTPFWSSRTRR